MSAIICLLFTASSLTRADTNVNQILPIFVLLILVVVLIVSLIGSIYELYEYWADRLQQKQKGDNRDDGPPLSVEDAQNLLIREFEMKLLPKMLENAPGWKPIEH